MSCKLTTICMAFAAKLHQFDPFLVFAKEAIINKV